MIDTDALTDAELDAITIERDSHIELSESGLTQRDALLTVTDEASLWRTPEGETYATVERNGHKEHHPIASRAFKDWLLTEFGRRYRIKGRPASVGETAIREARNSLEARAYDEDVRQEAPLRTVRSGDAIYIDTGRPDWSAFEVSAEGWRTVASPPVPIVRSRGTGAFPEPAENGDLSGLRQLLGHLGDQDFILFVGWCLAALYPSEAYPVLIFSGESGSGKTSLAQMAQKIPDPVTGDVRQPPANDRDLIAAARQGHVLAFDNISRIKEDLADSICRLATGAEIGGRALFTDHDSASFRACRPIILNGIPDLAARADLADRSVIIKPPPIAAARMTKADFSRRIAEIMPSILTGLLDALAAGLRNLDRAPVPDVRMSDFARLVIAAEPALPWSAGAFLAAYEDNRRRTTRLFVEGIRLPRSWPSLPSGDRTGRAWFQTSTPP